MGREITEMLEKKGCNVGKLVEELVRAAAAEFTTYYYYTILRAHTAGLEGEAVKEIVEDARLEDRNHFEALVPRIYELGGDLPNDLGVFASKAACPEPKLPGNPAIENILRVLLQAEKCAVAVYTRLAEMTRDKDPRTHDLVVAILHEEVEHTAWFEELLTGRPSGHFRRRTPGESPHVGRFLASPAP